MEREFKFRFWDKVTKSMYEAEYVNMYHCAGNSREMPNRQSRDIMQFTGLVDKNNVEIYEGDIVTYISDLDIVDGQLVKKRDYNIHQVIFKNGMFCLGEEDDFPFGLWCDEPEAQFEVIGNIYEDSDLLN